MMRISSNMALDNFIFQQQKLLSSMLTEQMQLSTGQAVRVPSDDPGQASRLLKLTEVEESQQQVLENIRFASDFLNATDAALSDVTDSLIRVEQLASGAVGSLSLPEERQAAAIEIDAILQQLASTANRQFLGLYLFGGRDVTTQPVSSELDGLRYVGDTGTLSSRLAFDGNEEYNLTAHEVFGLLSDRVQGSIDLDPAVTRDTRLDELNGANGLGVRLGSLRFTENGRAGTWTVDLTAATSIGQIIDTINRTAAEVGSGLTADLNTTGNGIQITPGDDVAITTLENGILASDLGILTTTTTGTVIEGLDLDRRVTNSTPIADLLGGAGLDFAGSTFGITNGSHTVSIDLTPAETVQDIVNSINNTEIGVRALVNDAGTGIDVLNEVSGSVMSIFEEGGTVATDLGIRTLNTTTLLDDLNFGDGVRRIEGEDDLEIVAKDGSTVAVNLDSATTIQDAIDLINAAATADGVGVTASLSDTGNGIRIADTSGGAGALQINRLNFSDAVLDLGLDGEIDPAATELIGSDVGGVRVSGMFSALMELREALLVGDERDITKAAGKIDESLTDVTRVQGGLGAEVRAIESRGQQTLEAVESTTLLLSEVRDLDFAEAITRFQQTQTALQASLMASGQTLDLSLLNFLS
jgi:flagellar hook-associated protein 3 FlgL